MNRAARRAAAKRAGRKGAAVASGAVLASGGLTAVAPPAAADDTIVVTSTDDDGEGTLRAAVAAANSDPDHDTIVVDTDGIIAISSQLTLTAPVTIAGADGEVRPIVAGAEYSDSRIFYLEATATGTVLEDLALIGGDALADSQNGGSIFSDGADLTLDGVGVKYSHAVDGGAVFLYAADLTITGSAFIDTYGFSSGGAVFVAGGGDLTVAESVFSDSYATSGAGRGGAIAFRGGDLAITSTQISDTQARYGGAVSIDGASSATIDGTEIESADSYVDGGAIAVLDTVDLTISNSVLSNSDADRNGGGLALDGVGSDEDPALVVNSSIVGGDADGSGGGVAIVDSDVSLVNVSVLFSYAQGGSGGGIWVQSSDVEILHGTVAYNDLYGAAGGAGIDVTGTALAPASLAMTNTILAHNELYLYGDGSTDSDLSVGDGYGDAYVTSTLNQVIVTALGPDLDGDEEGLLYEPGLYFDSLESDIPAVAPELYTAAIDAGDPDAVDAVDGVDTDATGLVPRSVGAGPDIGAVERQITGESDSFVVTRGDDDTGVGTLRHAVLLANSTLAPDTIAVDGDVDLISTDSTIGIAASVAIDGAGVTVSGGSGHLVFDIRPLDGSGELYGGMTVALTDVTVTAGGSPITLYERGSAGGAISALYTALELTDVDVSDSVAPDGGGVAVLDGSLTITGGTFAGNSAMDDGGAIYVRNSDLTISDATFADNTARNEGGAVRLYGDDLVMSGTTFDGNSSLYGDGGAVFLSQAGADITGGTFTGNTSGEDGGAVFLYRGDLVVSGSTFDGNSAEGDGGAAHLYGGTADIAGTFTGNVSEGEGGALLVERSEVAISDSTFDANTSEQSGGAVSLYSSDLSMSGSTFDGNSAYYDGGAVYLYGGSHAIDTSTFAGNTAGRSGGALAGRDLYALDIGDSTIAGNVADQDGGGIWANRTGTVHLVQSTISGNEAGGNGGGIWATDVDTVQVDQSTISGNEAGGNGGGVYRYGGALYLRHSTVTANTAATGAGVAAYYGQVGIDHTVLAGNDGADAWLYADAVATWSVIDAESDENVDQDENTVLTADPMLGDLADNGGTTLTHLPLDDSPVIDAGDPEIEADEDALDQRGGARFVGDAIDIGSVEVQPPAPPPTTTTTSTTTTTIDPGPPPTTTTTRPTTTTTAPPPPITDDDDEIEVDRNVVVDEGEDVEIETSDDLEDGEVEVVQVDVETEDGVVSIVIEQEAGEEPTVVRVTSKPIDEVEEDTSGFQLLGTAYEVEVTGGADGKPATVCFPYDAGEVADAGMSESDLTVFHFNDAGEREALPTTVDAANGRVCASVSSFSPFTVGVLLTERLAGVSAAGTAAAISEATFEPGVPVAYLVARGPDGLGAGSAAAVAGGPVLLVDRDSVPTATADELARLTPGRVVVVGGSSVISDAVVTAVGGERVAGDDRSGTAAAASASAFTTSDTVYVASGFSAADALVAGAAAGGAGAPLLLVERDAVPAATAAEIARLGATNVVVVGGTAAVSDEVVAALGASRLAGADRYATAAAVAQALGRSDVYVARGDDPVDAAAGIPAAAQVGAAIVLVLTDEVPASVDEVLAALDTSSITVLGGTGAISRQTEVDLAEHLG